jgi:hypothetical protein
VPQGVPVRDAGPSWAAGQERPKYLRWALIETATHAARHPCYHDHYQATKRRLGRQRGPAVARVEIARKLAEAIWHMLTTQAPFRPARPHARPLVA